MVSAMSSGVEILFNKIFPATASIFSSFPFHHLVSTAPRAIQLILMPNDSENACDFVSPRTADFVTAYGTEEPKRVIPAILPTLTIAESYPFTS